MAAERARGALAVAATFFLFLLFAQFGFLEQVRSELPEAAGVRLVMAAMGLAGLGASLATPLLLAARPGLAVVRRALVAAALVAAVSPLVHGLAALAATGAAIGATVAVLTVAVASRLPELLPGAGLGLAAGAATGAAYLAANLPFLFSAPPAVRALVPAAVCLAAALLLAERGAAGAREAPAAGGSVARFAWLVGAFAALVALDACAFALVQSEPMRRAATWGDGGLQLLQGGAHLAGAVAAGWALAAGQLGGVLGVSWALLAGAVALLFGDPGPVAPGGPLYALGVGAYSTALVVAPSHFGVGGLSASRRAALLYGLAGWLASAAGVGAAQELRTVPAALVWAPLLPLAVFLLLSRGLQVRALARGIGPALGVGAVGALALFAAGKAPSPAGGATPDSGRGRAVYIAEGCIHCHSQYVRPEVASDLSWWGPAHPLERAVAPVLIGNRRQGPDLAEVGARRGPFWQERHLRAPHLLSPGSRMPSYAHLFAAGDRRGEDLVAYLSSLGADDLAARARVDREEVLPRPPATPSAARGHDLFRSHCGSCHGEDGRGDGALSTALGRQLVDLTKPAYLLVPEGLDRQARGREIERLVRHGFPPSPMPGHESLPAQEVADLVAWVESLRPDR